ncbi:nuclear transport factor 2 family protein [Sedimentitalea sp. CY04]|uniref:Nuclear transport factor 2 family protein n=1 Tax=Parasedimentitalea denitrificans TaxID=2211118 RepID=A0ABX0W6B9_9RHOB|nr:nuclear transport factor 2 family protein [Sedimentitalea sp. CY04]NIZ61112.1 nuclear transport factor 2 family protein [Sedimentitalea sp. CY04]
MTKLEIMQSWFSRVWEDADTAALDELLSPEVDSDTVFDGVIAPRNELPELVNIMHRLVGPMRFSISRCLEDGEWCSIEYEMTADGPGGVTPVCAGGLMMARIKDDRIIEMTTKFDGFALFEQLGQLPSDALMACLTGQKLRWA